MRTLFVLVTLAVASMLSTSLAAETVQGCFAGRDASGQPARMFLTAERYGDYYEVFGQIATTSSGTFRIKADGWSGVGRMFRNHEGEAAAIYIKISDYSGSRLVLHVDGYGRFPFQAVPC